MLLISHRGNINGKNPQLENNPKYIIKTLSEGYDVEIDIWYINNKFYLGHDEPIYEVHEFFLNRHNLWCHAKNLEALYQLSRINCKNYFWHQTDDFTLTSSQYIWTYPNKEISRNSIAVLPELYPDWDISKAIGICSDYIEKYKK